MEYKITSVTSFTTAEGERLSYTYSKINTETGDIIESNTRRTIVIADTEKDALDAVSYLKKFSYDKLIESL